MTLPPSLGTAAPHQPASDDLLALVIESATDFAVIATDAEGRISVWNRGAERLLGHAGPEILGHGLDVIFTPEDRRAGTLAREMHQALECGRASDERWHVRRDGTRFWGSGLTMPLALPGAGFVKIVRDRTAERQAGERLREAERQLRTLVEGVPLLLWRSCNRGNWTWASPQWTAATGQSSQDCLGRGWLAVVHPEDRDAAEAAWEAAGSDGRLDAEFRIWLAGDARWAWHQVRSRPVRDADGAIVEWLGTTTDIEALKGMQQRLLSSLDEQHRRARALEAEIGQRRLVEAELLYKAFHDDLTRLHNRAHFINRLDAALQHGGDATEPRCAVMFLDLDRFKRVNDSLGHQAGDRLLVEVGRRLRACLGPDTVLARLGGDEFAALFEGLPVEAVVEAARAVLRAMRPPVWIGAQEVFASCSIGVVQAQAHHPSPEALLRDADIALYHAKHHDNGGCALFAEAMRERAVHALRLETDLRHAVDRGEFVVHYQPMRDARRGGITGVEALVRWQHPERGLLSPAAFIAAAEESGLIRDIGRLVLAEACAQMMRWVAWFPTLALRLGVNASGRELHDPRLVADTRAILAECGIEPSRVQIEVTEGVFLHDPDRAGEVLASLRGLGLRIALDDFGTGYSSLSYLDRYPVDTIKIDRSFVTRMMVEPRSVAIVRTIVALGVALGLDIVGEGVEDEAQLQALRETGCATIQGYLTGRPMSAAELTPLLSFEAAQDLS